METLSWQHCTYLNALNISKNTKHVNVIVVSLGVILPSSRVILNTHVVPQMIMKALNKMLNIRPRVRICSLTFLGGFFSTSGSTGSSPRLWAERQQYWHIRNEINWDLGYSFLHSNTLKSMWKEFIIQKYLNIHFWLLHQMHESHVHARIDESRSK